MMPIILHIEHTRIGRKSVYKLSIFPGGTANHLPRMSHHSAKPHRQCSWRGVRASQDVRPRGQQAVDHPAPSSKGLLAGKPSMHNPPDGPWSYTAAPNPWRPRERDTTYRPRTTWQGLSADAPTLVWEEDSLANWHHGLNWPEYGPIPAKPERDDKQPPCLAQNGPQKAQIRPNHDQAPDIWSRHSGCGLKWAAMGPIQAIEWMSIVLSHPHLNGCWSHHRSAAERKIKFTYVIWGQDSPRRSTS